MPGRDYMSSSQRQLAISGRAIFSGGNQIVNSDDFDQFKGSSDYVSSEPLRNAVNVSIALGRPLLIRGEPGTGKTLLAHSIARGLKKKLLVTCPQ